MNFKTAITKLNKFDEIRSASGTDADATLPKIPKRRITLHGRPYDTFFITKEDYPGYPMHPREWRREYREDIEYHFSTLLDVINKYFPKKKITYTSKLFQEFEKFAFENSTSF